MSDKQQPQGVVMVLVDAESGRSIADAADFSRSAPGGFTLRQAQESRCKRALAHAVINALASPRLTKVMDSYDAERILSRLADSGCRISTIYVGHEEP